MIFDGRVLLLLILVVAAVAALFLWAIPADRRDREKLR